MLGCQNKEVYYEQPTSVNYIKPSTLIVDMSQKSKNNNIKQVAKLNLELSKEPSIARKASLLIKIHNLSKK